MCPCSESNASSLQRSSPVDMSVELEVRPTATVKHHFDLIDRPPGTIAFPEHADEPEARLPVGVPPRVLAMLLLEGHVAHRERRPSSRHPILIDGGSTRDTDAMNVADDRRFVRRHIEQPLRRVLRNASLELVVAVRQHQIAEPVATADVD